MFRTVSLLAKLCVMTVITIKAMDGEQELEIVAMDGELELGTMPQEATLLELPDEIMALICADACGVATAQMAATCKKLQVAPL